MNRPEFPRDASPYDPRWVEFQALMATYLAEKEQQHLATIPLTEPEPGASNARMLSEPRKKRPAWSDDPEYYRAAKARQRAKDAASPKPCMDCGKEPRLPRKSRCCACDDAQQDRIEAAKDHRKSLIKQGLTARKRGECLEVRP